MRDEDAVLGAASQEPQPSAFRGAGLGVESVPCAAGRPAIGGEPVAYVDGYPITRAAFDAYAGVFADPGGQLQVSRNEVVTALINQELVTREAARLGVEVDEAAVDDAIQHSMSIGVTRRSLESSGGMEGLRARFEAFFVLKQVKAAVVGKVTISDDQVRLAHEWDPSLQGVTLAEVADVLRERLSAARASGGGANGSQASALVPALRWSTHPWAWPVPPPHRIAAETMRESKCRPPARFFFLALLIGMVGACSPIVRGTSGRGSETIPGPGYFHVTGDPAVADRMLTFRYVGPDGVPSQVSDVIQPGGQTVVDRTTLPGSHTLTINGVPCSGSFSIESDRETDLVVKVTGDGCQVSTVAIHRPGEFTH